MVRILFASCTLFLADIDQYSRCIALCLVPVSSTESFLPPMHRQVLAPGRATLRNPIYPLNLRRHQPLTHSRIKASDKISISQVPLPIPVHGTFLSLCVLALSSRRRSLQVCRVVNSIQLRILFAPTRLLVDAPGTSRVAIVAPTKGGVPDLPQWWARRTEMNTEFLAEGYQRITGASVFLCIMTYRARTSGTSRMIMSFSLLLAAQIQVRRAYRTHDAESEARVAMT